MTKQIEDLNRRKFLKALGAGAVVACSYSVAQGSIKMSLTPNLHPTNDATTVQSKQVKALIAYYSWGGNTQAVARNIQSLTEGDLFEVKPVNPYTKDYEKCVKQARKEIDEGFKPEITDGVKDISKYDIIFVGSPNWWSHLAPPIATFLSQHDLTGKTLVPFCTHGGGRQAEIFKDMAKLYPTIKMLKGLVIDGNSARRSKSDAKKWLQELKLID